ncbi:unnamed protein product, partial [Prorocentrum cordatum]
MLGAGTPLDPPRASSPGSQPTPSSPSRSPSRTVRHRSGSKGGSDVEQRLSFQGSARKGETGPRSQRCSVDAGQEPEEGPSARGPVEPAGGPVELTPEQQEQLAQEQKMKQLQMVFNRFKAGVPSIARRSLWCHCFLPLCTLFPPAFGASSA